MAQPLIFGFSGKSGSGKDHVASIFGGKLNGKILYLAFADPAKMMCGARYGLTYEDLYGKKTAKTRERLQTICDEIRSYYSDNFFVNAMNIEVDKHHKRSNIDIVVISDVRFPEEVEWIKSRGGYIYRIEAPKRSHDNFLKECKGDLELYNKRSSHNSEVALDDYVSKHNFTDIIKNEVEDDLVGQLDLIIAKLLESEVISMFSS